MSLDVYLVVAGSATGERRERIFVRRDGAKVEVTREEWDAEHPGREPSVVIGDGDGDGDEIYTANITHNLKTMADAAGLYDFLWRPDEYGLIRAQHLIPGLRAGVERLRERPDYFERFNPENGWGDYALLVRFTEEYLAACQEHPDAEVRVSR